MMKSQMYDCPWLLLVVLVLVSSWSSPIESSQIECPSRDKDTLNMTLASVLIHIGPDTIECAQCAHPVQTTNYTTTTRDMAGQCATVCAIWVTVHETSVKLHQVQNHNFRIYKTSTVHSIRWLLNQSQSVGNQTGWLCTQVFNEPFSCAVSPAPAKYDKPQLTLFCICIGVGCNQSDLYEYGNEKQNLPILLRHILPESHPSKPVNDVAPGHLFQTCGEPKATCDENLGICEWVGCEANENDLQLMHKLKESAPLGHDRILKIFKGRCCRDECSPYESDPSDQCPSNCDIVCGEVTNSCAAPALVIAREACRWEDESLIWSPVNTTSTQVSSTVTSTSARASTGSVNETTTPNAPLTTTAEGLPLTVVVALIVSGVVLVLVLNLVVLFLCYKWRRRKAKQRRRRSHSRSASASTASASKSWRERNENSDITDRNQEETDRPKRVSDDRKHKPVVQRAGYQRVVPTKDYKDLGKDDSTSKEKDSSHTNNKHKRNDSDKDKSDRVNKRKGAEKDKDRRKHKDNTAVSKDQSGDKSKRERGKDKNKMNKTKAKDRDNQSQSDKKRRETREKDSKKRKDKKMSPEARSNSDITARETHHTHMHTQNMHGTQGVDTLGPNDDDKVGGMWGMETPRSSLERVAKTKR